VTAQRTLELAREGLRLGRRVRLKVYGASMTPTLQDGQRVELVPLSDPALRVGEVVACDLGARLVVHRVVAILRDGRVVTRGDAAACDDPPIAAERVLGRACLPLGGALPPRTTPSLLRRAVRRGARALRLAR
jgi:hypothetical protein